MLFSIIHAVEPTTNYDDISIYCLTLGMAPYTVSGNQHGTPQHLKQGSLPGTLHLVGMNRAIYLKVLNFNPQHRISAITWLKELPHYTLVDVT